MLPSSDVAGWWAGAVAAVVAGALALWKKQSDTSSGVHRNQLARDAFTLSQDELRQRLVEAHTGRVEAEKRADDYQAEVRKLWDRRDRDSETIGRLQAQNEGQKREIDELGKRLDAAENRTRVLIRIMRGLGPDVAQALDDSGYGTHEL